MTDHTTHAERLRAAATRLRERVDALDPWDGSDEGYATWAEEYGGTDRALIATMHPGVALEMSLLLDAASRAMRGTSEGGIPFEGHFLELADAVLGDEILGER